MGKYLHCVHAQQRDHPTLNPRDAQLQGLHAAPVLASRTKKDKKENKQTREFKKNQIKRKKNKKNMK